MDNFTISSIIIISLIIIAECLFGKSKKELIMSVIIDLLKAVLSLAVNYNFIIIFIYEFGCILISSFYLNLNGHKLINEVFAYVSFVVLIIIPVIPKLAINVKITNLIAEKIIHKYTVASLLLFIVKSFEPSLLICSIIELFLLLLVLIEINYHNQRVSKLLTDCISVSIFCYSIFILITNFNYSLAQQLCKSFVLPSVFWIINIPLLFLLKYFIEFGNTLNWIECRHKFLKTCQFLIVRIYWFAKLHNQFKSVKPDIFNAQIGGIGRKIYSIHTQRKLTPREQKLILKGYKYLILNADFYKGTTMTFPIAINLFFKNDRYCNWHYKNVDPTFIDLVK